jgi:hypothetical protein
VAFVLLLLALVAGCGPSAAGDPDASWPQDGGSDPAIWAFALDAGAFARAAWPGVVVVAPAGFRLVKPVRVVIWIRGLGNCATNVVRDRDGECTPDAGLRDSFQLAAQLQASARNALLIVPELDYDSGNDDPGTLTMPIGLRALLAETLNDLKPWLGNLTIGDLAPLIVAAHSAGWRSQSAILQAAGLPVAEVWQFDSFFDGIPPVVNWIQLDPGSFVGVPPKRRLADLYTDLTEADSENLAQTAETEWLPDAGAVLDDRGTGDILDDALRLGLVFKASDLSHNDVPRVWFRRLLATSPILPPR